MGRHGIRHADGFGRIGMILIGGKGKGLTQLDVGGIPKPPAKAQNGRFAYGRFVRKHGQRHVGHLRDMGGHVFRNSFFSPRQALKHELQAYQQLVHSKHIHFTAPEAHAGGNIAIQRRTLGRQAYAYRPLRRCRHACRFHNSDCTAHDSANWGKRPYRTLSSCQSPQSRQTHRPPRRP